MNFFEEPPPRDDAQEGRRPPWLQDLESWLMAPLLVDDLVHRSPSVVLWLHRVQASPVGFSFTILAAAHPHHHFEAFMFADLPLSGLEGATWPGAPSFFRDQRDAAKRGLRVDLRFPDGRMANGGEWVNAMREDLEPRAPLLLPVLGSSGRPDDQRIVLRRNVWPLPPPGPVTLTVNWPAEDIERVEHILDGSLLREASQRAQRIPPPP